jgi:hypothetical protein
VLMTMGQNPHCTAEGQSVITGAAKQSLPKNRDCFVAEPVLSEAQRSRRAPRNDNLIASAP